jgi:prolyl 4-hydroxylase
MDAKYIGDASLTAHGADWCQWIVDNLERACDPLDMYDRMVEKVWNQDQAIAALDAGMVLMGRNADWKPRAPILPSNDLVRIVDREISILARSESPRAALFDGLLTQCECQELISFAFDRGLLQSGVVDDETGDKIEHQARTSTSVSLKRGEIPLIAALEERLSLLTRWPADHAEGLQVLRYQPGQQYKPHFDAFRADQAGGRRHLERGGQRVATTVIYLTTPIGGGETAFPTRNLKFKPRAGGAIFFHDLDPLGRIEPSSLHAGNPVTEGEKIVATYWQLEGVFV